MKRRIAIFFAVVCAVFAAGMVCVLLYAERLQSKNDSKESRLLVDFSSSKGDESEEEQPQESSQQESTDEDDKAAQSLALYEEAVAAGQKAILVSCEDEDDVTFLFAGDVLLDSSYAIMANFTARGSSVEDTFTSGLLEAMQGADVFMINNEFPFSDRGTPTEGKEYTFRAKPDSVSVLIEMGVDLVSLANNHAYDYGNDALLDTFDTLSSAGIPYVGAGENIDEAKQPVYVIANGIKIAVVSATQIERISNPDTKEATATSAGVLRCLDPTALLEVIAEAKENSDFVILFIHWGTESQEAIDWYQEEQSLVYAQAGVDLIIGAHPHCLQKIDVVEGVPVVYSLGNFWFNSRAQDTGAVRVVIGNDGIESLQFLPCRQEDCRTSLLSGEDAQELLEYMQSISPNVEIDGEGYVEIRNLTGN